MEKLADKTTYEFYLPPPKMSGWESFKLFLWNSETKQFLGRNGKSWTLISIFYCIYYTCLAGFFASMLMIFYQTLPDNRPKWILDDSIIGTNPGLGFRPIPEEKGSTLLYVDTKNEERIKYLIKEMKDFLEPYHKDAISEPCDFKPKKVGSVVCPVHISDMGVNCTELSNFGYYAGQPCVAIKLNKIYGWVPEPYNKTSTLPEEMPESLKREIENTKDGESYVWLSCDGESAADKELIGEIHYNPKPGFATYYYPYITGNVYQSPLVMAQFMNLTRNILVKVECRAWAYNIKHARQERRGLTRFEILVE